MTRTTAPEFSPTGRALVVGAGRAVVGGIVDLARALRDRQEIKRLIELDDRALKDIGLSRSQVDGALAEPLFRNPSTVLLLSVERRSRAEPAEIPRVTSARPVVPLVKQACCA